MAAPSPQAAPALPVTPPAAGEASVSVVIPAYNAADTIGRALDSVAAQTVPPDEVIVVDDGSTDGTAALVAARTDLPIRLIASPGRSGAAAARNLGIAAARGEFVAFLDADDEWLPEKLARQLAVIVPAPRMSFVACRSFEYAHDGSPIGPIHADVPVVTGPEAWRTLLAATFVSTPCVLARRSVLQAIGGFDQSLPIAEDQDLWIRLALAGEVGFVDEVLVRVHERPTSLSRTYKPQEPEIALRMALSHIARERGRLTRAELHHALATRLAQNGRRLYAGGQRLRGLAILARAVRYGGPIWQNLQFVLSNAPGAAALKARLRALRPRSGGR
jgi:glycosyltransferase involved in cell wall biosynthesis